MAANAVHQGSVHLGGSEDMRPQMLFTYGSSEAVKQAKLEGMQARIAARMAEAARSGGGADPFALRGRPEGSADLAAPSPASFLGDSAQFQSLVVPPEVGEAGEEMKGSSRLILGGERRDLLKVPSAAAGQQQGGGGGKGKAKGKDGAAGGGGSKAAAAGALSFGIQDPPEQPEGARTPRGRSGRGASPTKASAAPKKLDEGHARKSVSIAAQLADGLDTTFVPVKVQIRHNALISNSQILEAALEDFHASQRPRHHRPSSAPADRALQKQPSRAAGGMGGAAPDVRQVQVQEIDLFSRRKALAMKQLLDAARNRQPEQPEPRDDETVRRATVESMRQSQRRSKKVVDAAEAAVAEAEAAAAAAAAVAAASEAASASGPGALNRQLSKLTSSGATARTFGQQHQAQPGAAAAALGAAASAVAAQKAGAAPAGGAARPSGSGAAAGPPSTSAPSGGAPQQQQPQPHHPGVTRSASSASALHRPHTAPLARSQSAVGAGGGGPPPRPPAAHSPSASLGEGGLPSRFTVVPPDYRRWMQGRPGSAHPTGKTNARLRSGLLSELVLVGREPATATLYDVLNPPPPNDLQSRVLYHVAEQYIDRDPGGEGGAMGGGSGGGGMGSTGRSMGMSAKEAQDMLMGASMRSAASAGGGGGSTGRLRPQSAPMRRARPPSAGAWANRPDPSTVLSASIPRSATGIVYDPALQRSAIDRWQPKDPDY